MSSLVLLAIVPFLNNNNVYNSILHPAVAQGYGYDDNYGETNYSTYPTYDKKYECRTGPFEGFFVSSVEFCKHIKFDDRKDNKDRDSNRTGTQGPAGPQGPPGVNGTNGINGINGINGVNGTQGQPGANGTNGLQGPPGINGTNGINGTQGPQGIPGLPGVNGTQGPQGPAGISKINGSNYYSLTGPRNTISGAGVVFATSTISCLPGDFALSGEYQIFSPITGSPIVTSFASPAPNPPTSWSTTIFGVTGQDVQTTVNCFDNSP